MKKWYRCIPSFFRSCESTLLLTSTHHSCFVLVEQEWSVHVMITIVDKKMRSVLLLLFPMKTIALVTFINLFVKNFGVFFFFFAQIRSPAVNGKRLKMLFLHTHMVPLQGLELSPPSLPWEDPLRLCSPFIWLWFTRPSEVGSEPPSCFSSLVFFPTTANNSKCVSDLRNSHLTLNFFRRQSGIKFW